MVHPKIVEISRCFLPTMWEPRGWPLGEMDASQFVHACSRHSPSRGCTSFWGPSNSRNDSFRITYRLRPTQMKQHHNLHHRSCLSFLKALQYSLVPVVMHAQLDIEVMFEYPNMSKLNIDNASYLNNPSNCSRRGSAERGILGPFGLLVMADDALQEQTAIFFYLSQSNNGSWVTHFYSDQSR